jgi:acetylornithine deacetylase
VSRQPGPPPGRLGAAEARVLAHLDETALVESLARLVRVPSVGGSEAEVEVQEVAAGMLSDIGLDVDRWDADLAELASDEWFPGAEVPRTRMVGVVGTLDTRDATEPSGTVGGAAPRPGRRLPALVLQGHLDVVPPGDPDGWHGVDPFAGEVRGGALHGRGAVDMKAGVAANIAVARTLRAAGVRLRRPLAVHCAVAEEDGGLGALATLRRGHLGEAAVITEPTSGRIVTATAGALTFRIEVTGLSAHGSMRRRGVSAFETFLPVHAALADLEARRNRDVEPGFVAAPPYALSFGVVRAGEWSSSVPDRLVAEGRYGVRLGEDPREARRAFEDVVATVARGVRWLRDHPPVVTWPGGQFASGSTDEAHPLVGEVSRAVVATGGEPPALARGVYGSDLRLYTSVGGIPTVHYGPGDMEDAHSPSEKVDLAELVRVTRALVVLALRRCGGSRDA